MDITGKTRDCGYINYHYAHDVARQKIDDQMFGDTEGDGQ